MPAVYHRVNPTNRVGDRASLHVNHSLQSFGVRASKKPKSNRIELIRPPPPRMLDSALAHRMEGLL